MSTDFRDLLEIKEEREYGGISGAFRTIERIPAGNFSLSIQASHTHYCTPRETVPLWYYTHWEVAAFDADGDWMSPVSHPEVFDGLAVSNRWERGVCSVGPYLPTKDVQELYERLVALSTEASK